MPGMELPLKSNVFIRKISDFVKSYLMKMKVSLAKGESQAGKRNAGGAQIKPEAAFGKAAKTTSSDCDGSDYYNDSDNFCSENERLW